MDAKLTLSFDQQVIDQAKEFAKEQGLSLSRFIEILLRKATAANQYANLEEIPVADWVMHVAEDEAQYGVHAENSKSLKAEYFESRKK